jgi:hypothetical protein
VSRMIVEAVVGVGSVRAGNSSPVPFLLSVTDADGKPYTGLQVQNFQVQLMADFTFAFTASGTQVVDFDEENKNPVRFEHVPGIYQMAVSNLDIWSPITYTAIIKVQEQPVGAPRNHGQTMIQFRIPA